MKEQFILLITNNQGLILKVCNVYCSGREDKEDLFQDIILQLWRAHGTFKADSKVSTWIYRIALNTAITRFRKETKRGKFAGIDDDAFEIAAIDDQEDNEKVLQMYKAIKKLPEVELAITMLYMEEYSYREIGDVMGLSESNVGFKLTRIRTKLKTIVNNG